MKEFLEKMINNNPGFSAYLDEVLRKDKIVVSRFMAVATFLLFGFFYIVDFYSFNRYQFEVAAIRSLMMAYLIFVFFMTFKKNLFISYYGFFLVGFFVLGALTIEWMIYLSTLGDLAFYTYFAGIMMLFIGMFTWTYLNSTITLAISLAVVIIHILNIASKEEIPTDTRVMILINHVSFLMGAVVLGLLADILVKHSLFRQYQIQKRLRQYLLNEVKMSDSSFEVEEIIVNRSRFSDMLQNTINDASTANLTLTLSCVQLPFSSTFKSEAVNQTINRILIKVLPARSLILTDEKRRYYYAYLLRNEDREQVNKNNQLIMSLLGTLIPDIGRIGFGNVIFYQETHNAVELLAMVDRVITFNDDRSSVQADYHHDKSQTTLHGSDDNGQETLSHNVTPIRPLKNS